MRCPKCGFISFDHLENCLKCKKNIKNASDNLSGSVYNVAAPAFLKFTTEPESDEVDVMDAFMDDEATFVDDEISDPDLDILLDDAEDSGDDEIQFEALPEEESGIDIDITDDDEDDVPPSFSLDDFDDEVDFSDSDDMDDIGSSDDSIKLGLPDELSDMTDLEPPPVLKEVTEDTEALAADDDFDLDLDFDLNLDDGMEDATPAATETSMDKLSLGDLDFDDEPATEAAEAATKKKTTAASMDLDDLNFELDLGDLHLDDDEKI